MPRFSPIQNAFNAGEFSPRLYGRTDLALYARAAAFLKNFQVTPQGPLVRRSGTRFVSEASDSTVVSRLIPFVVSDDESYVIELSHLKMRFFRNEGKLLHSPLVIIAETQAYADSSEFLSVGHGYAHNAGPFTATTTGTFDTSTQYFLRKPQPIEFSDGDVSTTAETISKVSHNLTSRMGPFRLETSSTIPGGLELEKDYWINVVSDDTFQLSETRGGTSVNITSAGDGDMVLRPTDEYARNVFRLAEGRTGPVTTFDDPSPIGTHTLTLNTATIVEIDTPYLESELFEIQFDRSADVMYLVHRNHAPRTLSRFSAQGFSLEVIEFDDGPYLDINADADHTMQPSANTGNNITITSSKAYWTPADVGTPVRIDTESTGNWGWARIVSIDPVTFDVGSGDVQTANMSAINVSLEQVTATGHLMDTGELVRLNVDGGGVLPDGLTTTSEYWIRAVDANTLAFYTSKQDAIEDVDRVDIETGSFSATPVIISSVIDVVAHGFTGGEGPFRLKPDTPNVLPGGFDENTDYYIGFVDVDSFYLTETKNGRPTTFTEIATGAVVSISGDGMLPVARANVKSNFGGTTASTLWRVPAWSSRAERGFPAAVSFHEQRLWFGGNAGAPLTLYASVTADFLNFRPTGSAGDLDSTVNDDNALTFVISSNEVNNIQWMSAIRTLIVGTASNTFSVQASTITSAITPSNVQILGRTAKGSLRIRPIVVDDRVVYISDTALKAFSLGYSFESDSYLAEDLTLLAEEITESGITQVEYAPAPFSTAYMTKVDGEALSIAIMRDQNVSGWGRIEAGGTDVVIESVAVIPSPAGDASSVGRENRKHDQVWLSVRRTVNGSTVRWIEFIEDIFATDDSLDDAFFVDGGITYNGVAKTSIDGLTHLANETVDVLADGNVLRDQTVSAGGVLTLDEAASKVHIGFRYESDFQSLRLALTDQEGSAQGKLGRIDHLVLRLDNTMGGTYGPNSSDLTELDLVPHDLEMGTLTGLFTGDIEVDFDAGWDTYGEVYVRQADPLPMTLVALLPKLQKGARGNRAR